MIEIKVDLLNTNLAISDGNKVINIFLIKLKIIFFTFF